MLAYYEVHIKNVSAIRHKWLDQYFINRLRLLYKLYLIDIPHADFKAEKVSEMDAKYMPICNRYNWQIKLYPANKILRTEYISYWHKHQKRWPIWYEKMNAAVDIVVKWLYVKIIRR